MTDDEAIDAYVRRTGVERFRHLCSPANTNPPPHSRADYLRHVREMASAPPAGPEYPPAATQAANLAGSLWTWAVSGFSTASEEEVARRQAICAACPEWDAAARRCRICGCLTDYKTRMRTEHCPLSKW